MLLAKRAGLRLGVADELNDIFFPPSFRQLCPVQFISFLRQDKRRTTKAFGRRRFGEKLSLTLVLVLVLLWGTPVFSILTKVGAYT